MKIARCFLGAGLALIALAGSAVAGPSCYKPEQTQAEHWLRLHSELMVITVTCRQASDGQPLPAAYGAFTQKNLPALRQAEQTMISYYKATAKGDAVSKLDRLRTQLGNEFGQKVADMSAPEFCAAYRDKVVQFTDSSTSDVKDHVQRMASSERPYVQSCGAKAAAVTSKKGL